MSSKILIAGGVALALAGGTKLYMDNVANEKFNNIVADIKKDNPSIDLSAENVSYNPLSKVVYLEDLKLTDNDSKANIFIEEVSFTEIDDNSKEIPLDFQYTIKGLQLKVKDINFDDKKDRLMAEHLAGEDGFISFSAHGSSIVSEEDNMFNIKTSAHIKRLGFAELSFGIGGIYHNIKSSLEDGSIDNKDFFESKIINNISLNNTSLTFGTDEFKELLSMMTSHHKLTEEEVLKELNDGIEKLKNGPKEYARIIPHLESIRTAFEKNKEVEFSAKINSEIDQAFVMVLFMNQGIINNPEKLEEYLGLELKSKVK